MQSEKHCSCIHQAQDAALDTGSRHPLPSLIMIKSVKTICEQQRYASVQSDQNLFICYPDSTLPVVAM